MGRRRPCRGLGNNPSAWCDKLEWVKKYLKDAAYKRLILSHHKDLLRGDFLIDDGDRADILRFQGKHIQIGSVEHPTQWLLIGYAMAVVECGKALPAVPMLQGFALAIEH